jgi:hypothetical protein
MDTLILNSQYRPKLESVGLTKNGNIESTISLMKAVARCILAPSQGVQDKLSRFYNTYSVLPFQQMIGIRILCDFIYFTLFYFLELYASVKKILGQSKKFNN